MKKLLSILMTLIFAMSMMTGCSAAENKVESFVLTMQIGNPNMTVNGTEKEIDPGRGTVPVVQNDRTLVPTRAIIEAMGGSVNWDEETQTAFLEYNGDIITLAIGNRMAYFNETANTLDVAPTVINDRTMLPIRFIAESFKFNVDWDGKTQTITITKSDEVSDNSAMQPTEHGKVLVVYLNYILPVQASPVLLLPPNHVLLMNRMPKAYALAFLPFSVDEYHRQSQKFQSLSYELSHAQPPVKTAD